MNEGASGGRSGAILYAKKLTDFGPSVERKGVRFVAYAGTGCSDEVSHRQDGQRGYAAGSQGLVDDIDGLPQRHRTAGKTVRDVDADDDEG